MEYISILCFLTVYDVFGYFVKEIFSKETDHAYRPVVAGFALVAFWILASSFDVQVKLINPFK